MNSNKKTATILEDPKTNIKTKLSGLWVATVFLFIYVDYFGVFVPGVLEKIIEGEVADTGIQITPLFLVTGLTVVMIPSLMIVLSLTLKAKANRWTNIIVGILQIVVVLSSNFIGESEAHYIFGSVVEVVLLSLIVWFAWKWPKQERVEVTP